jgi:hypothetical protein
MYLYIFSTLDNKDVLCLTIATAITASHAAFRKVSNMGMAVESEKTNKNKTKQK